MAQNSTFRWPSTTCWFTVKWKAHTVNIIQSPMCVIVSCLLVWNYKLSFHKQTPRNSRAHTHTQARMWIYGLIFFFPLNTKFSQSSSIISERGGKCDYTIPWKLWPSEGRNALQMLKSDVRRFPKSLWESVGAFVSFASVPVPMGESMDVDWSNQILLRRNI